MMSKIIKVIILSQQLSLYQIMMDNNRREYATDVLCSRGKIAAVVNGLMRKLISVVDVINGSTGRPSKAVRAL